MSQNITAKKWLVATCNGQKCFVTITKCDITLLSVINRYKSLYVILDIFLRFLSRFKLFFNDYK